mgnify:CR=1 FL=1
MKDNNFVVNYDKNLIIISICIFVIPLIFSIVILIRESNSISAWIGFVIIIVMYLIIHIYYKFLYVEIKDGELIYNRLFRRRRIIKLKDIKEVRPEVGAEGIKPFIRLTIVYKKGRETKELHIASYNLDSRGCTKLLKVLQKKVRD